MRDFDRIVRIHRARYPLMQPQDFGKLAYQSEFGPEHMIADERDAAKRILAEWQTVAGANMPCNPEPIGNGLCRFHMTAVCFLPEIASALARLFMQSAREHTGTREGLETRLSILARLQADGMEAWLEAWRRRGCPPVHHSTAFREAYRPHYRVLSEPLIEDFLALCKPQR